MKRISILLVLTLLLGCLAGCGSVAPTSASTDATALETAVPSTETTVPVVPEEAEYLQDFTVQTVDGGTFTLSEALDSHELVLVNLFATWCPPCKMEFPYLQEAWEQEQERVAVIALSVEPTDTLDVLKTFAEEMGLTFPIGRTESTDLNRFVTEGIPTTIVADRTGRIATVEIGAKSATQQFLDLFDEYSGADYDPALCTYSIYTFAFGGAPIEGVVVNFCTDTTCTPVVSDSNGVASFRGVPARYHVQVVSAPEGWQLTNGNEWTTEPYSQTSYLTFTEDGQ